MKAGARIDNRAASSRKRPSIYQWAGVFRPATVVLYISLSLLLASGLSVVITTHDNRFAFNELQELKESANKLEVELGQLLIEQSTFGVEGKIELIAVEELQMQVPELANIIMVSNK
jgi:cell division protein FtsL